MKISTAFLKQLEEITGSPAGGLWLTLSASLSCLNVGLVFGYSSSALPSIEIEDPHLIASNEQKSWIGAMPPLGAFFGCLISGILMQKVGRRRALQLITPFWVAGWLIIGFAQYFSLILLGRLICGLCLGLALAPTQVYVSECCDPEIRGRLGSLPTLALCLGILLSYIAGNWLFWRYLAFFSAIFCVVQLLALFPLPESPVWLEVKGQDPASSIKWLQLSARATVIIKDDSPEEFEKSNEVPSLFTRKVFFSSVVIKPFVIGFSLLFFQQFSGIDAIVFFTVEIFENAGSQLDAMTATLIIGLVQLICTGLSALFVDRVGRRPLLLLSAAVMSLSLGAMGASFHFEFEPTSFLGYLPVISLVLFMIGFSSGFSAVPILLLGELFPAHYRSQLSAMAASVNLLSMFTVIKSFHALNTALTSAGTFWMYACFCILAFFFVLFTVPETKGKSLAEIEQQFRSKKSVGDF